MQSMMLSLALRDASLLLPGEQTPTHSLPELAHLYQRAKSIIDKLSRVIDSTILNAVLHGVNLEMSSNEQTIDSCARLTQWLSTHLDPGLVVPKVFAEFNPAEDRWSIRVERHHHGNLKHCILDYDFIKSEDYRTIKQASDVLSHATPEGTKVQKGVGEHAKQQPVSSFSGAMEWLLKEADRGLSKQRYKGLGEMNPEQLWETTMNSETRTLLQVKIEDAISADAIFTTLMGEEVEPRRVFIESNALRVANLDI
jgi:Type IIA topoisomerase (DNA gyrase/topo II, topoisomerase IV), B subunit